MTQYVPFVRVTHSGLYADGRPNTSSVLITDVPYTGQVQQNRKTQVYVPAGGFVDLPYSADVAFSYNQGDIRRFTTAGLVTSQLMGAVPPLGINQYYYQDNPGADGVGTYAQSYAVLLPMGTKGMLSYVSVRCEVPPAAGETATIRLYRYRKTAAFGSFSYAQITDTFVLDSTDPWSWTIDISANIRDGYLLDPATDMVAVSVVYTNAGGPTLRALRVDFQVEIVNATGVMEALDTPSGVPVWPI